MSRTPAGRVSAGERSAPGSARSATAHERTWSAARPLPQPGRQPHAIPLAEGLQRPRLLRRLDGVLGVRLGSVVAPPGTGKTTLIAHWARRAPVDVAWYRCERADASLLAGLARAIEPVSRLGTPYRLDELLRGLDERDSPLVLVLDDVHLVARDEVVGTLHELLTRMPAHVHLLIGSREPLSFNLIRTEVPSLQLGASDLRFRTPETDELFRTIYHASLAQDDCRRLARHTEGWAAALRLFHLQTAGLPADEQHRAVLGLSGQVRYAREYLGREILADLPGELVDLLRSTSVLETLTGRRCDLLLGTTHSQRSLLDLEQRGVLTASAAGCGSFRLPTVLRTHLATQLRDHLGDLANDDWLREAARITTVEPGGDPAETVRLYVAAGAWPDVLDCMDRHGVDILRSGDLDWLDRIPLRLRQRETWLRLSEATRAMRDGQLDSVADLATIPEETETTSSALALSESLLRSSRLWSIGDIEPDGSWFDQLRSELRRPTAARAPFTGSPQQALLRAIGCAVLGDLREARQRLQGCLASLHDDLLADLTGQLVAGILTCTPRVDAEALADRAETLGMPWFARMAQGLAAADGADPNSSLALRILDSDNRGDAWGALLLSGIQCVTELRAGTAESRRFEDLVARCHALDCPALEAWARAGLALAAAAANLPDAAREAQSSEGYARCAAVPGAVAVSYGALAVSGSRGSRELTLLAEAEAEVTGLDCRPWTWVRPGNDFGARPTLQVRDAPALDIRCFGRFELRVGGKARALSGVRPKARAVLRLLALHAGRPVHREVLIDALWPDLDATAGTHNLQVCVSSLRTLSRTRSPARGERVAGPRRGSLHLATARIVLLRPPSLRGGRRTGRARAERWRAERRHRQPRGGTPALRWRRAPRGRASRVGRESPRALPDVRCRVRVHALRPPPVQRQAGSGRGDGSTWHRHRPVPGRLLATADRELRGLRRPGRRRAVPPLVRRGPGLVGRGLGAGTVRPASSPERVTQPHSLSGTGFVGE